jgi:hypothetical protein
MSRRRHRAKITVEECLSLDLARFATDGISAGVLEWINRQSGKAVLSVTYLADTVSYVNNPYLLLQHAHPQFLPSPGKLVYRVQLVPRPEISLDSALGTFKVENVLKEQRHVQRKETRFRGRRRSPESSELIRQEKFSKEFLKTSNRLPPDVSG